MILRIILSNNKRGFCGTENYINIWLSMNIICQDAIEHGLAAQPPVSVNKVLLEHNQVHSFIYYL